MHIKYIFLTGLLYLLTIGTCTYMQSKRCGQLVIDTYEIYAEIDIPPTSYVNCYYEKDNEQRISLLVLARSISLRKFKPIGTESLIEVLPALTLLEQEERPVQGDSFVASGEKLGVTWHYLYDQS